MYYYKRQEKIGKLEGASILASVLGLVAVLGDLGRLLPAGAPLHALVLTGCLATLFVLPLLRFRLERPESAGPWQLLRRLAEGIPAIGAVVAYWKWTDTGTGTGGREWLQLGLSVFFLINLSRNHILLHRLRTNPALLFLFSFLALILFGTAFLLLPVCTEGGLSFTDAVFTSTSAVCVTGLTVVDTGTHFTRFGQSVLLVLISLGGLGIMTFTSFFGLLFREDSSFRQLSVYRDILGAENIKNAVGTVRRIVGLTLFVEGLGAACLFGALPGDAFADWKERAYFALFHAVSAFNNAGFSLPSQGMYDAGLRFNYPFLGIITAIVIFGGFGFAITHDLIKTGRQLLTDRYRQVVYGRPFKYRRLADLNTRLVLITTSVLLVAGTLFFYGTESAALQEHRGAGRWVASLFCSMTPRTAGFNNIDMALLSKEGILLTLLLMWIGASPGSTGGGIKTSTVAVAAMAVYHYARGREHMEFAKREIAQDSVLRAFVIIIMSLVFIGLASFTVTWFDPGHTLEQIVFECVSAFSTAGLSLGITSSLSDASKGVLILAMLFGRVGVFTLLLGLVRRAPHAKTHRFPVERVLIT